MRLEEIFEFISVVIKGIFKLIFGIFYLIFRLFRGGKDGKIDRGIDNAFDVVNSKESEYVVCAWCERKFKRNGNHVYSQGFSKREFCSRRCTSEYDRHGR